MPFMDNTNKSSRERLKEKEISGRQRDAAVDCWFTSTGRLIPRLVKFETDTGARLTVRDIHVVKDEKKNYAGIYAWKFWCKTIDDSIIKEFVLVYRLEECTWKIVV